MKWYNVHFYKIMKPDFGVNILFCMSLPKWPNHFHTNSITLFLPDSFYREIYLMALKYLSGCFIVY